MHNGRHVASRDWRPSRTKCHRLKVYRFEGGYVEVFCFRISCFCVFHNKSREGECSWSQEQVRLVIQLANKTKPFLPPSPPPNKGEKKENRVGVQAKAEKLTEGSMLYQGLLLSVRKDTWPIQSSKLVCEPLTKNSTFRQFPFQKNFKRNPRKLCRGHLGNLSTQERFPKD